MATMLGAAAPARAVQTCAVAKLKAAAKDAAGQLKCFATAFPNGPCIVAVDQRLTRAFAKADAKFGAGGCRFTLGDSTLISGRLDDFANRIAGSLTLHFVDNGDGTVTDNVTGLQWEKKVAGEACTHCVNDVYTWSNGDLDPAPDGTAFTSFLGTLNQCLESTVGAGATGGFAGHCDWRLPTIDELVTIRVSPCSVGPCIDPTFGPTAAPGGPSGYWSATTSGASLDLAWFEHFDTFDGREVIDAKSSSQFVRAVRGP